jgi:hypothetical protein
MTTVDEEWQQFLMHNNTFFAMPFLQKTATQSSGAATAAVAVSPKPGSSQPPPPQRTIKSAKSANQPISKVVPQFEDLNISTKTKVLFLNIPIDIRAIFWKIPIIEYWKPEEGIVKKQIKIVSKTPEELDEYKNRLETVPYFVEHIIKQYDNPNARRFKFKDERKITIGISKKDIMCCRGKAKNAFYNCFAIIYRFKYGGMFREIHIKIFNTGKLEIPGLVNPEFVEIVKKKVLELIAPIIDASAVGNLYFTELEKEHNVLINSNFNCNYFINREKLHDILRSDKYNIESAFDPCSYPGVKCKFYFNHNIGFDKQLQNGQVMPEDRSMKLCELLENKKYTEISFMVFRTGSCLIVGNCTEQILLLVYEFIKGVLIREYHEICISTNGAANKNKQPKIRKKSIHVSGDYYAATIGGVLN